MPSLYRSLIGRQASGTESVQGRGDPLTPGGAWMQPPPHPPGGARRRSVVDGEVSPPPTPSMRLRLTQTPPGYPRRAPEAPVRPGGGGGPPRVGGCGGRALKASVGPGGDGVAHLLASLNRNTRTDAGSTLPSTTRDRTTPRRRVGRHPGPRTAGGLAVDARINSAARRYSAAVGPDHGEDGVVVGVEVTPLASSSRRLRSA